MPDSSDPLIDSAGFLLSRLGLAAVTRLRALLLPMGLDPRQYGLLLCLGRNDGQSQQQLADLVGIHRNAMVGLVDDLEERGLVERRRHPSDRRAHAVHLTGAARDLLPEVTATADRLDDELLTGLDGTERERLMTLLRRMAGQARIRPDLCEELDRPPGCAGSEGAPGDRARARSGPGDTSLR